MGRCHVVTGGCRGVGRALAERLLDDGGTVAAVELDPAAAVAHLLSDAASFVNGATVPVDGGRSVLGPDPRRATRAVGVPRRQRKLVDIPVGRMVAVRADAAQEQEWLRQLSLVYSGLIGIGVLMVQPFLTASSLDLPAKVCVVAFSVAIPLLASLVVLNRQEAFRRRATRSVVAQLTRVVAQTCAFVGVVAGFWHILWIAGVGVLASGLAAVAVHSASYWRLERDQAPTPQEGEEPGDAEP